MSLYATVKPLTEAEQDVVAIIRRRTAPSWTHEEFALLLELVDRLPREPRKKTLGQVLYEKGRPIDWMTWDRVENKAHYEEAARVVIDEHERRKAGG